MLSAHIRPSGRRRSRSEAWLKPIMFLTVLIIPLVAAETCARRHLEKTYGSSYPLFGLFGGHRQEVEGLFYHTLDPVLGWNISSSDDRQYFGRVRKDPDQHLTSCGGFVILRQRGDLYWLVSLIADLFGANDSPCYECNLLCRLFPHWNALGAASAPNKEPTLARPLRIVTLGGSTTDQMYDSLNWPVHLVEALKENGRAAIVFNGGVGGYGTKSELLKLVRDVRALAPDIVISYSGVNEASESEGNTNSNYRESLMQALVRDQNTLMPNLHALLQGIQGKGPTSRHALRYTLGIPDERPYAEIWLDNLKTMRAILDAQGIDFIAFLQPAVGTGRRAPSEQELAVLGDCESEHNSLREYARFYPHARNLLAGESTNFIHDLSHAFDEMPAGIFTDNCHLTPEGNRHIAEMIMQRLLAP